MEAYGAKGMVAKEVKDWASQRTIWATEQVQGQDDQFRNALKKKKKPVEWLRIYRCVRIESCISYLLL